MKFIKNCVGLLKESWSKYHLVNIEDDMEIQDFDHQPYIDCYLSEDLKPN